MVYARKFLLYSKKGTSHFTFRNKIKISKPAFHNNREEGFGNDIFTLARSAFVQGYKKAK